MRVLLLSLLVLLFLSGCASGVIMMQDPKTGHVFQCGQPGVSSQSAAEDCARALERAGWKRL